MRILSIFIFIIGMNCLISCKKDDQANNGPKQASQSTVKLLSWSEYFDPEVIEEFTRDTGLNVDYITYDDPDEIEARLASEPGKFDVVIADDLSINRLSELRLIQLIDDKVLPNFSNISNEYIGKNLILQMIILFHICGEQRSLCTGLIKSISLRRHGKHCGIKNIRVR